MTPWGCYSKIQTVSSAAGQITSFVTEKIKNKKNPEEKKKRDEMTYKWNKI